MSEAPDTNTEETQPTPQEPSVPEPAAEPLTPETDNEPDTPETDDNAED